MNRKTILSYFMTLAAVLFMGTAFGQIPAVWPGTIPNDVKIADTIWVCAGTRTPVELKYDVSGAVVKESQGKWTLLSWTTSGIAGDYIEDLKKLLINGNVFNTLAAGGLPAGYIFEYTASGAEQCGLLAGQKVWSYIFIMPDLGNINNFKSICKGMKPDGWGAQVSPDSSWTAEMLDFFAKAELKPTYADEALWTINYDSTDTYKSELTLTGPVGSKYNCQVGAKMSFTLTVRDSVPLAKSGTLTCIEDTVGKQNDLTWLKSHIPGRSTIVGGKYDPVNLKDGVWQAHDHGKTGSNNSLLAYFTFSYPDCKSGKGLATVRDSVIMLKEHNPTRGFDTANVNACSLELGGGIMTLDELSKKAINAAMPGAFDPYIWSSHGNNGFLPATYITVDPNLDAAPPVSLYRVDLTKVVPNLPYYYRYKINNAGSSCLAGDTGILKFIMTPNAFAVDYRAQMCLTNGAASTDLDLGAYTGLGSKAVFTNADLGSPIVNGILTTVQLKKLGVSTHKIPYTIAGGACGTGKAMFYLRLGTPVYIPTSVTEQFCKTSFPATFNVNDLIGLAQTGGTWAVTIVKSDVANPGATVVNATAKFDAATGVFDMSNFMSYLHTVTDASPTELVFTLSGADCAPGLITLTVKITDTLK